MKTLKKTLCLVLAVVMVLGLGAISASAKLEYTDNADINYAEAVDVMSGIGILQGNEGAFSPKSGIDRASAAKIIAYIMIGNSGQADALKATSAPFNDVPATHWAAGYIAYCANAGIINGTGDGNFKPNDQVTGLAFAKMLLTALGYGVKDEYTGTDWAINVSRDALRLNVFTKNLAGASNTAATREECALYAFNAITKVKKVSYSELLGGYITTGTFGSVNGNDAPDANKKSKFQEDFLLDKEDNAPDAFGRDTGHHWYLTTAKRPVISANYDADEYLKGVYTTAVSGADIYNLLGSDVTKKTTTICYYEDGVKTGDGYDDAVGTGTNLVTATDATEIVRDNFKKDNNTILKGTGNGVQTYIYAKYEDSNPGVLQVKICVINTWLAQVTSVKPAKGNTDAVTNVEVLDVYANRYYPAKNWTLTDTSFNTDKYEVGDYVLVNIDESANSGKGAIKIMNPAKIVESTVTRYNNTRDVITITAGGNTYGVAKITSEDAPEIYAANDGTKVDSSIVDKETHILYLDSFDYVIGVGDVKDPKTYVYLAQLGTKADTTGKLTDKDVLMGHVYYADGTDEIVTIDTKNQTYTKNGVTYQNDFWSGGVPAYNWGAPAAITDSQWTAINNEDTCAVVGLYQIAMNKGKAVLQKATSDFTGKDVTKGVYPIDSVDVDDTTTYRMNGKTVYFYVSGKYDDDDHPLKVVPYTSVNSIPKAKTGEAVAVEGFVDKRGTAGSDVNALLVKSSLQGDDGTDIYFFLGTDMWQYTTYEKENSVVKYFVYDKNGEMVTLTYDYETEAKADDAIEMAAAINFYTVNSKNQLVGFNYPDTDLGLDVKKSGDNKTCYVQLETAKPDVSDKDGERGTDEFTLRLWSNADDYEAEYALFDAKIIDLRDGYDVINSTKTLKQLILDANEDLEVVDVAFAYGNGASRPVSLLFLVP